jgi:hypothetical protein
LLSLRPGVIVTGYDRTVWATHFDATIPGYTQFERICSSARSEISGPGSDGPPETTKFLVRQGLTRNEDGLRLATGSSRCLLDEGGFSSTRCRG